MISIIQNVPEKELKIAWEIYQLRKKAHRVTGNERELLEAQLAKKVHSLDLPEEIKAEVELHIKSAGSANIDDALYYTGYEEIHSFEAFKQCLNALLISDILHTSSYFEHDSDEFQSVKINGEEISLKEIEQCTM